MSGKTLGGLIDIAIEREEASYAFYKGLKDKVDDKEVKDTMEFLAAEELKHKEFLEQYRDGRYEASSLQMAHPVDYKIAEHFTAAEPEKDMDTKDVYLVAAHRELLAYNFYTALADLHPDGEVKEILMKMASQELKHKEKVEYLYANTAFPQTAGG
jgi:rubrerythrin